MSTFFFTLPFAGANKYAYRSFAAYIPPFLHHVPLEYPGRGLRSGEPLCKDLDQLTEDLYEQVKPYIARQEYILYGHSMGGQLAWLLARRLIDQGHRPPRHIIVSGTPGPSSLMHSGRKRYLLGRKDFLAELRRMDENFAGIFDDEELLDYFEPVLRADFMACENFNYRAGKPLDIPFTVLYGDRDNIEKKEIDLWALESRKTVDYIEMKGKHFFILSAPDLIMKVISKTIAGQLYPHD
jgi:surfactin synthase thioesterase subunit